MAANWQEVCELLSFCREAVQEQSLGSLRDTVIFGNMVSQGCTERPATNLANEQLCSTGKTARVFPVCWLWATIQDAETRYLKKNVF